MCDPGRGTCESLQTSVLVEDINACIKTLSHTQECLYRSHYEDVIKEGRYQLLSIVQQIKQKNCRKPSLVPKDDLERDIFFTEMECLHEETKINHVRKEWTEQQNALAKLQEDLYKKCRLLSLHSSYSSTQGNALSAVLAVLMKKPELVEAFLLDPDTYLKNFIKIADGCLFSFVKTYSDENPLEDSTDYRYIISLYTCIISISESPRGRQYLIQREECQNMLTEIIFIIPLIKYSSAKHLKTILLKILHNLKNEPASLHFLRGGLEIFSTLNDCIMAKYDPESYKYALELLEFVTRDIPSKECIDKITDTLDTQRLKELSGQMYREVNNIPTKIFQNIRIAADKILAKEQEQAQGDILRSKSSGVCKCKSNKSLELRGTQSTPSSEKNQSKQEICVPPISRPTSANKSCSSHFTAAEYSSTSRTPTRDTPQSTMSRPASGLTDRSVSSHKKVGLCSTPCKYLFPDSTCSCRPRSSGERPSNIPIRKTCIPTCSSRSRKPEKKPNSPAPSSAGPSSGSRPGSSCNRPCSGSRASSNDRQSSCSFVSSCSKASSKERPSSGSTFNYIKEKIIELATSASKKFRSLYQSEKPSCSTKTSSCVSKIPTRRSVTYSKLPPGNKKIPCPCATKNKNMVKSPPSKTSRLCMPRCKGPCKYKNRKAVTPPTGKKPAKSSRNPCSCITTKAKSTSPDSKQNIPSCSESKPKPKAKQASSDLECQKPKRVVCTDKLSTPVLKCTVSYSKSPPSDETQNKAPICAPICAPSLGTPDTSSPTNSSPSVNTECEEEICTCGSISERRLVPWTPENRMIARLSETDRRVCHRAENTIRIISKLENNITGRPQRVIARIRIPGLRFQHIVFGTEKSKK